MALRSLLVSLACICGFAPLAWAQMQTPETRAGAGWAPGDYIPVDLKCPDRNNGILELTWREYHGIRTVRSRVRFVAGSAEGVSVAATDQTNAPLVEVISETSSLSEPDAAVAVKDAREISSAMKKNVCDASPRQKDRFLALLKVSSPLLRRYADDAFDPQTVVGNR